VKAPRREAAQKRIDDELLRDARDDSQQARDNIVVVTGDGLEHDAVSLAVCQIWRGDHRVVTPPR
jgi:hypothetical protein